MANVIFPLHKPSLAENLSSRLLSALSSWIAKNTHPSSKTRNLHSYLRATVPDQLEESDGFIRQIPQIAEIGPAIPYLSVLVYLLSNNILADDVRNILLPNLVQMGNLRLLETLLSNKTPTVGALAE